MSDIETEVYDSVTSYARAEFPGLVTTSWPDAAPASYPFASVIQTDEYDVRPTLTSSHENEARHVTFEVNVYSAKVPGRKQEAKAISAAIARRFKGLGFVQTAGGQPLDLTDQSKRAVARYFSRFEAAVHNGYICNP